MERCIDYRIDRFTRNQPAISVKELELLRAAKVCIVGLGGLGGYAAEMLVRCGVGHLTLIDGDDFAPNNLNRQIYSNESNIGQSKTEQTAQRLLSINSDVTVEPHQVYLNEQNAAALLANHDLIIDALDNIESRFILDEACHSLGITYVHGAAGGWCGQAAVVFPGEDVLRKIYSHNRTKAKTCGVPAFAPAVVAAIQVSLAVKVLARHNDIPRKKLLIISLTDYQFWTCDL